LSNAAVESFKKRRKKGKRKELDIRNQPRDRGEIKKAGRVGRPKRRGSAPVWRRGPTTPSKKQKAGELEKKKKNLLKMEITKSVATKEEIAPPKPTSAFHKLRETEDWER